MLRNFTYLFIAVLCAFSTNLKAQTDDETNDLSYFFYKTTGVDSLIVEAFDTVTNRYIPVDLEKYTYNAACKVTRINEKEWDLAQRRWNELVQRSFTYDAQNRVTNEQIRVVSNNIARDSARVIHAYNAAETQPTSIISQSIVAGTWVNESLQEFSYTTAKKINTQTFKEWNGTTWQNVNRIINTFDAQNRLLNKVEQEPNTSAWVNTDRTTFAYTAQNVLKSARSQKWLVDSSKWDESTSPLPIDVSADGRTVAYEIEFLGIFLKTEYKIGANKLLSGFNLYVGSLIMPYVLLARARNIYNPPCTFTPTEEVAFVKNAVTISPNPATDKLTIGLNNVENTAFLATITNLSGQIVDKWTGNGEQQRDINVLPNGLYFLSVRSEKWQTVQKFVVQR